MTDLDLFDYILKAIAILSLCSSIYLLVKNFEPNSSIIKLLYGSFSCAAVALSLSLCFYFAIDDVILRRLNLATELLFDISAGTGGIASLLRLEELLPLMRLFTAAEMKKFQYGIKIAIAILVISYVRNLVGRVFWFADYTSGWLYYFFYWQAGLIFYVFVMLSDLVSCTWIATYIQMYFTKKNHPMRKSYKLKIWLGLVYIAAIAGGVAGAASVNGKIDVIDNIVASIIVIYYTLIIRVLVEMKKMCSAFKTEVENSHSNNFSMGSVSKDNLKK